MIAKDVGFDDLCLQLEPVCASWREVVVPNEVQLVPNNLYSQSYAWMYSYEKSLRSRIEGAIGHRLGELERQLFGADGVVSEGLSNAFVHGHGRAGDLPIGVQCVVSSTGIALSIRDQGRGFDVARALEALSRGQGYFSFAGNGLRSLERNARVLASWGDGGRTLHLRVMLDDSGPK